MLHQLIQLKCPDTDEKLIFDDDNLKTKSGKKYKVVNTIPILIPDKAGKKYIEHYEKDAEIYDYFARRESLATHQEERRLREMISSYIPKKSEIILDVGSGGAWLASKFVDKKRKVISMDISQKNIELALQKVDHPNHFGLIADALHLPIIDNQLDCIVASEVIEHVTDPKIFVEKLFTVLKPGGKLIITTPNKEEIKYILCIHCNQPTPLSAHLHSFDESAILQIIDSKNLKSSQWKTFINNYLNKARFNVLFQFLPFRLWRFFDYMANKIFNKPTRLMVIFEKA